MTNGQLMKMASISCKCSCIEEYLVNRDLHMSLSTIDRILDPIAFIMRHPHVALCFQNGTIAYALTIALIAFSSMIVFLMAALMLSASEVSVFMGWILTIIGSSFCIGAIYARLLDACASLTHARILMEMRT